MTLSNVIVVGLVLLVVALIAAALLRGKLGASGADDANIDGPWPYTARKLMSDPEQVLFLRLRDALPDHVVLAQVAVSRILGIKGTQNRAAWLARIARLSVDFVIARPDTSVVAVIELDDATHDAEDRKATDLKKDRAFAAAGIRVIRWRATDLPEVEDIRKAFSALRPAVPITSATARRPAKR